MPKQSETWITRVEAADRLGVTPHAVSRIIANGHLTVKVLPETHPQILAEDVDRLLELSVRRANAEPTSRNASRVQQA